ncbi:MAG: pyridoxal-dependent decarboxylase [candidate division KSB1 bacterium]|nr:pyridoxal-dependent decarboxylase [candidate division KSB1 bacterium]
MPLIARHPKTLGDMDAAEFKKFGYQVIDWIANYFQHPEKYPVLAQVEPGEIRRQLPQTPPETPEDMKTILADFDRLILPGITHWNHPAFFAYFSITGSAPGILAELLSAALNVNAMLWKTAPAATELEEVVLDWLRQMLGLPKEFQGVIMDTASVSSLCAIAAAREAIPELKVREQGLAGRPEVPRLRLYTSEQAHSSIEKAAIVLGLGQSGLRKIPTDAEFRMNPAALAQAIAEDLTQGWRPFCVVATVGTTSTTSIDPVPRIADICQQYGLWLHVDAAYGGSAAILPEMRQVLDGCDRADSLVVNPHKWLFAPIDVSAFYCRKPDILKQAFSLVPEYLRTAEDTLVRNYMDYGIQLGRRFRALKLWMIFRYYGRQGLMARLREHIRLAQQFAGWVDAHPDFQRLAPVPFSTVCFHFLPKDLAPLSSEKVKQYVNSLNEALLEAVNKTGEVYLSHTKLQDTFVIRLAIGNIRTTEAHVTRAWELLQEHGSRLDRQRRPTKLKFI